MQKKQLLARPRLIRQRHSLPSRMSIRLYAESYGVERWFKGGLHLHQGEVLFIAVTYVRHRNVSTVLRTRSHPFLPFLHGVAAVRAGVEHPDPAVAVGIPTPHTAVTAAGQRSAAHTAAAFVHGSTPRPSSTYSSLTRKKDKKQGCS